MLLGVWGEDPKPGPPQAREAGLMPPLCAPGHFQHHGDGAGPEPLPVPGGAAAHHQVRAALRGHRAPRHHGGLHAAHGVPPVPRPLAHQGAARRHRGLSHGTLQVGRGQGCGWGGRGGGVRPAGGRDPAAPFGACLRRYIRPSMLQHLLRRLVFDVPILNEFAKMPLKVSAGPLQRARPSGLRARVSRTAQRT